MIKIGWQNRVDGVAVNATSELSAFPVSNVQHPHLSRRWHTAAGVNSAALTVDLGASLYCSVLAVLGSNLTPAATVRIRSSDSDPTALSGSDFDSSTMGGGVKEGYGSIYKLFEATQSRYWRIDLDDSSAPSNLQIGRVYFGPYWQPSVNMSMDWSITPLDESRVVRSWGGQSYPEARPKRRMLQFVLDFETEAEMFDNAFALQRMHGVTADILAIPDSDGAYLSEQAVWGQLAVSEPISEPRVGLFRQRFSVVERL